MQSHETRHELNSLNAALQAAHSTPNDAKNEMRNKTAILGGDVLFFTNYGMKATGVAYRCGGEQ